MAALGEQTLNVLNSPSAADRIAGIAGFSKASAQSIKTKWDAERVRECMQEGSLARLTSATGSSGSASSGPAHLLHLAVTAPVTGLWHQHCQWVGSMQVFLSHSL